MGKVVTKEWTKVKNSETGFFLVLAAEIIQVLDSKAWPAGSVVLLAMF